jgi:MATE family multidrug resistance protein
MTIDEQTLTSEHPNEASFGYILRLAGPMVITTISFTVMQFVDRIMVSRVGTGALAAVYPAGVTAFLPGCFILGVTTAVATFVSQNHGRGQKQNCSSYCWQCAYFGIAFFIAVTALMWPLAPCIFRAMEQPQAIIPMEVVYFRILLLSQIVTAIIWSSSQFFMGIHRPKIIMYAALSAQVVNVAANYILIFGKLGLPAMGIAGAAWGTFLGVLVGAAIRMSVFLAPPTNAEYASRKMMRIDLSKMYDLIRVGFPAGLELTVNVAIWGIILSAFVGKFGKEALAATSAVLACTQFAVMPVVGMRNALTAAVGKAIGAGKKHIAVKQTSLCLRIAFAYMGVIGLGFLIFRHPLMRAWTTDETAVAAKVISLGAELLILAAFYQVFHAARIIYSGALRGAGDTVWLALISASASVLILGLGGWLTTEFFPNLGAIGPWTAATLSIMAVGLANRWRFKTNQWMKIDLFNHPPQRIPTNNGTIEQI